MEPNGTGTDAAVVRRVRRGDREAYRVLVERYQDTLFRCALSMVHERDTAAELVQATFVHAYANLAKLRDADNFGGWVYRMCTNRCRDWLKSHRRRDVPLESSPGHLLASPLRADEGLERAELRRSLDDALSSLSDEYREAFMLKHVEEKSYDEMSGLLGVTVPALKMRVHRAREALRSALEEVL
ncbi:MAG TPA: sigma-70 family RNA polymerase sigma factor [Longimicrobiales bacterium]|nr:sigma-70 family RNA polymerase sigma factor [Longimicrobiales bacterium]